MTTPTSQSPLYPKVISRLQKNGAIKNPDTISPSDFLTNHESSSEFWTQAHTLSCLQHGSFHSSVETTYVDTMPLHERNNLDLNNVREILTGDSCARLESDGTIINSCPGSYKRAIGDNSLNKQQIKTIASLASAHLTNHSTIKTPPPGNKATLHPPTTWIDYITSPVRKFTNGISYAIDSVLGDEFTHMKIDSELDDEFPKPKISQIVEDDDANAISNKEVVYSQPLSNADGIFSLEAIASSCRSILAYTKQLSQDSDVEDDLFVFRANDGSVDRIILHRSGCGAGTMETLCRQCGKYYSENTQHNVDQNDLHYQNYIANLLSIISNKEVDLLVETLIASNHAIIDEDTITLFPNSIPPNYTHSKSDNALFQIHTTRTTIQHRIHRLERDAKTSQQNAVKANRNKTTKLALMHMKRRKAALDEIERCTTLISNLDASELRLHRAKDDAQLVQTFALVKDALQDVRVNSGVDDSAVEELMLDIQEMGENNLGSVADGALLDIDEDELNREFHQLELECAVENGVLENETDQVEVESMKGNCPESVLVVTEDDGGNGKVVESQVGGGIDSKKKSVPLPC